MEPPPIIGPPPGSVVLEIESPGFEAPAPDVRNRSIIPAAIAGMMAPSWDAGRFPATSVRFFALHDVFVVGEGLVFDRALNVFGISMTQHGIGEAALARDRVRAAIDGGTVIEQGGTALLCQKRGMTNFGHWLIELLPIAHLALPQMVSGEWRVIVPQVGEPLDAVLRDSMAMIGVPAGAVVASDGAPRHVETLIVAHGLTFHGLTVSPLVMDCMDTVMAGIEADPAQALWVSRLALVRRLWNEPEVERVLRHMGWRVISPGEMAFRAQVAAFKGAARVAGVHGAGLTGVVFAAAGTPVTSFAPAAMPDTFFWLLTTLRRQRYVEVRAPHDRGWHGVAAYDAALVLSLPQVFSEVGAGVSV